MKPSRDMPEVAGIASDELFELVYEKLRRIASVHMAGERRDHTLQPTALVHEVYLRVLGRGPTWENERQFFTAAAEAMRRILIDHARERGAQRRGGGRARARIDPDLMGEEPQNPSDFMVLHEALIRLERQDPRAAEVVKLRFFAGLTIEQTARVMELSPMTVKRTWASAIAWLRTEDP